MKKAISVILAVIMVLSTGSFVFALEPPDYNGHWAEQDIRLMMDEGIVSNYGNFYPDENITRADFATFVSNLLPEPPSDYVFEKGGFLDVVMGLPHSAEPPYYTTPIYYLHSLGIVQGDNEGFFHPQNEITREDIAVILYRLLEVLEYQYPYATNGGLAFSFADSSEVAEYAYDAVFHLTRRSRLMVGYGSEPQDGSNGNTASIMFRPKNNLTRAEAITVIARIFKEIGKVNVLPQDKELPVSFDISLLENMPKDKNYMVSPFSLKMALAMAANGASGETKDEILKTLGIDDLDVFNKAAIDFITNTNASDVVEFNVANSIWHNSDYYKDNALGFSDKYKNIISEFYNGVASEINNENGAKTINDWIAKQTKEKINDVVTDDIVKDCLSLLVNTIYFKGDWLIPFQAETTRNDVFTDRSGKEQTTAFMNHTGYYSYFENEDFQILAKPYKDNETSMYFVLPKNDNAITTDAFYNALDNMTAKNVRFSLPKFKTEYLHENLIDILTAMGIATAFNPNKADFLSMYSKMPPDNIYIGTILQKTFIEVDEKGTEAAAATVIGMAGAGMPTEIIDFKCDRPFTYFIINDNTEDILFMGEYAFVE